MKPVVDYLVVIPKDEELAYVREIVERTAKSSMPARMTPLPALPALWARAPTHRGRGSDRGLHQCRPDDGGARAGRGRAGGG